MPAFELSSATYTYTLNIDSIFFHSLQSLSSSFKRSICGKQKTWSANPLRKVFAKKFSALFYLFRFGCWRSL